MVYYFTSTATDPPSFIYVGKDKFENEDLIKYGLQQDIWFHVDNLSSAHIYIRMPPNAPFAWDTLPQELLIDCAQLTKANSIEGNKKPNVTIIYTPWSNLRKDGSMAAGQVSFHDPKKVKKIFVAERENAIVNRLNKTKVEKFPDLAKEKEDDLKDKRRKDQADAKVRQKEEARLAKERKEAKHAREHAYDGWNDADAIAGSSNQDRAADWEEDFM